MTDTEKLQLITEHAREYYANPREYKFVDGGFIEYEIFQRQDIKAVYIANIFVTKDGRGGEAFADLVKFSLELEFTHDVKAAYARTEFSNPYLENMKSMYKRLGFIYYYEDEDAMYFKLER